MDQGILNYVQACLQNGQTPEQIKNTLLNARHAPEIVDESIAMVTGTAPQQSVTPAQQPVAQSQNSLGAAPIQTRSNINGPRSTQDSYEHRPSLIKGGLFKGRIGRKHYIIGNILLTITLLIISLALFPIFTLINISVDQSIVSAISIAIQVASLFLSLGLHIRRLHDTDKSGWYTLLFLIPLIGFILALYLSLARGTLGTNTYGNPKNAEQTTFFGTTIGHHVPKVIGIIINTLSILIITAGLILFGLMVFFVQSFSTQNPFNIVTPAEDPFPTSIETEPIHEDPFSDTTLE